MRYKKIRGHKRRWKDIDRWIEDNKNLNFDYLQEQGRDYTKVRIPPWSNISMLNSEIPTPYGITRLKIIEGLLDIYEAWKARLDELGEPYYLKIWFNESFLTESQVVCAVGDFIQFYNSTFFKPESQKTIDCNTFGKLAKRIGSFNWEYRLYENYLDAEESLALKQKNKPLKSNVRVNIESYANGRNEEHYNIKLGTVWIGSG